MLPALAVLLAASLSVPAGDRVADARAKFETRLRILASEKHLAYPFGSLIIRAFKREKAMELWAADEPNQPHIRLRRYMIAAWSGELGPKRREGDGQVPEGLYEIDRFNPSSQFHLSMRLNYPNASDRVFADKDNPGTDIYIHGSDVSIGCMAMTDRVIEELYLACYESSTASNRRVQVLVLPYKGKAPAGMWPGEMVSLWEQLFAISNRFDETHVLPRVRITADGAYVLRP